MITYCSLVKRFTECIFHVSNHGTINPIAGDFHVLPFILGEYVSRKE